MDILLLIVFIFALFAWSRAMLRFKDKAISVGEFAFWTVIWTCIVALTAFRDRLNFVADIAGLKRPVDVLIYFSIVLLFYLMFRLYVKIDGVEQGLTKVVREIAIKGRKR